MLAEQNEIFGECANTMAQLTEDEKIRMQCEARKDYLALEKGIRKRVRQEGLAEGLAEGEHNKAIQIAKELLDVLDIPTIAEKTGLSQEEVEKLAQENK